MSLGQTQTIIAVKQTKTPKAQQKYLTQLTDYGKVVAGEIRKPFGKSKSRSDCTFWHANVAPDGISWGN